MKYNNLDKLVPVYLMSCYLYTHDLDTVLDDPTYDSLCQLLYIHFDLITHYHKIHIDKEALKTGTTMHFRWDIMPRIIGTSAIAWSRSKNAEKKAIIRINAIQGTL